MTNNHLFNQQMECSTHDFSNDEEVYRNLTQREINMAGVLDIDLGSIKDPNEPAPKATYKLAVKSAEKKESDTGSKGAAFVYGIMTPGEHQGKQIREYVNLIKKDGTVNNFGAYQVQNMLAKKGVKKGKLFDNLPQLVGLEFEAEVDIEIPEPGSDREQYGPQNVIKRILK